MKMICVRVAWLSRKIFGSPRRLALSRKKYCLRIIMNTFSSITFHYRLVIGPSSLRRRLPSYIGTDEKGGEDHQPRALQAKSSYSTMFLVVVMNEEEDFSKVFDNPWTISMSPISSYSHTTKSPTRFYPPHGKFSVQIPQFAMNRTSQKLMTNFRY